MQSTRHAVRRRRLIVLLIAATTVLAVLVVVLVAVVVVHRGSSQVAKPATPEPLSAVATVHVPATFTGWAMTNPADTDSTFSAERGTSKAGSIALRVDSTAASGTEPRSSLSQSIVVRPSTLYTFGAWVRTDSALRSNVAIFMGSSEPSRFEFPSAAKGWVHVTWTYRTPAKVTQLPLRLSSVGPVSDFLLDNLAVRAPKSTGVSNGSFEEFSAPTGLTNSSLILVTGDAKLGVSWPTPRATWSVTDVGGQAVAHGTLKPTRGLGMINLSTLRQGYYVVNLVGADSGVAPLQSSFIVLDRPKKGVETTDARFGVNVHLGGPQYSNFENIVREVGFTSVRTDATWAGVELSKGTYTFPAVYESAYKKLAGEGVSVLPIIDYANPLYDGARTPSTATGIQAFANYAGAFVNHYSSQSVEIYNEFNNPPLNSSGCGTSPSCYLPLLAASYAAVKSRNPATTVVGPVIARYDDAWLTGFYKAGGLKYVDAVSFHPYNYTFTIGPEFLEAELQQANGRIAQYDGGASKPIWITELGWSTGVADYSEQSQAQNLVRAETVSFANGVQRFYWYDLIDDGPDSGHESNFGLFHYPSSETSALAPKPSAMAQVILAREIAGKDFTSRDGLNSSTYSYVFGAGRSATRVAWATAPTTVSYASSKPVSLTTEFGETSVLKPVNGIVRVQLTGAPVYLEGALGAATIVG
jgi:polysaccharide biosynthesis protein PslG